MLLAAAARRAWVHAWVPCVWLAACSESSVPANEFDANVDDAQVQLARDATWSDASNTQPDASNIADGAKPSPGKPDAAAPEPQFTEPLSYQHIRPGSRSIHIANVNLCEQGIELRATGPSDGSMVVSSFAKKTNAVLAINGGHSWAGKPGPSAHEGKLFGLPDQTDVGQAILGDGFASFVHMFDSYVHDESKNREVMSGLLTLVHEGAIPTDVLSRDTPTCSPRHPRTLMGLTKDKEHLLLVVVDGRRNGVVGMTCMESAEYMKSLGAYWAVNLDGGGSTTMVVDGRVVNTPSDGSERVVPTHLAVLRKQGARTSCPGTPLPAKEPSKPEPPSGCGRLASGASLAHNQSVQSCDRRFNLVHQADGNVVLYQGNAPLFDTKTNGKSTAQFAMQGDGNLVLYSTTGVALWNSKTQGNPGAWLGVQDDGNAVIYSSGGAAIWSTRTGGR